MVRLTDNRCRFRRSASFLFMLMACLTAPRLVPGSAPVQEMTERIVSEHLRIRMPVEREWLGREAIAELERGYLFIHRITDGSLPRRILITVSWTESETEADAEEARIRIGMNKPAASADSRAFLLHATIREMARLALLARSEGGAGREECRFLLEGMTVFLTHEYDRSSRSLNAAWARCHLLDRIKPLSLAALAPWREFSQGRQDLRAASPGITFLMMCREQYGRDRLLKLFETLREKSLRESLREAFRMPAQEIERIWIERVRAHTVSEDLTVGSEEDAPKLERTALDPPVGVPGTQIRIRALIRDRNNDLLPENTYLEDTATRRIIQAQTAGEAGVRNTHFELPIERQRTPGDYGYRLIVIDEAGNLRVWEGTYRVGTE